jgi:hypothetical protein
MGAGAAYIYLEGQRTRETSPENYTNYGVTTLASSVACAVSSLGARVRCCGDTWQQEMHIIWSRHARAALR